MDTLFPQSAPDKCRVCDEPVVDGRYNYCCGRCREIAEAVQRKFLWDTVREKVKERDDHTCQACGLSKDMQWRAYWQTQEMALDHVGNGGTVLPEDVVVDAPSSGFFHVDHIQRIADDGHPLDESNLQTLCKHCHHEKTAEENRGETTKTRPEIPLQEYADS